MDLDFLSIFPSTEVEKVKSLIFKDPLERTKHIETKIVTKSKQIKWVELYINRIKNEDILILISDITKRKEMEEERQLLVNIVEQVPEAIILTDKKGVILYTNPAFGWLFNYSLEEIKWKEFSQIWEDKDLFKKVWDFVNKGNTWSGRIRVIKKDKGLVDVFTLISALKGPDGEIRNILSVKRDITQELRLEREISKIQRLQAIGTLTGGIAHDFNNILTTILGYIQLAMSQASEKDKIYSYLDKCLQGCFRAKELIAQLLTFSRPKEEMREPIFLSPIIKEAVKFFRSSLPANISIKLEIKDESIMVKGSSTQIYQILVNLITNAAYAMKDKGGELIIKLDKVKLDFTTWMVEKKLLLPGEYALLLVKDTGVGIDPEVLDRVFEPFFTTKPRGEGTGMGLAVVYGIVKSYNGYVHIESEVGKGTTVSVFLPLYKAS